MPSSKLSLFMLIVHSDGIIEEDIGQIKISSEFLLYSSFDVTIHGLALKLEKSVNW